ncbi:TAF15 RNA polymerase II, TATA box binding protein (TBP)-associated factor (predicted), isoform CRA_b [Rattus norvegicus]|uniref:TAF15 RNA polymerase II, TATA box binding protein (TBP)-associated factor (Predicted), isoform CRA_b n=1 Tax=Rattus norvegicus TaxID=10116 RepID=A6HHI2_RAT|nr:TAF15 RNA polymerase II, TATA box binding protein (TBP)-associated factor (predicted), isoform CRA_b [Rattus norvegicus]
MQTAAGGPMEETVVVAVEAMVETEVVATEETEVGVMEATEVAMEETEVAMEAKWEEEMTTEMISATDRTDDCFQYSLVSDMIHGELSECACCFPHGLLSSEIDIWVFIWVGGLGTVFL